jgi:hypothetical protein
MCAGYTQERALEILEQDREKSHQKHTSAKGSVLVKRVGYKPLIYGSSDQRVFTFFPS